MIILLYGPDTYRSKQKLKEIIEGYKKAHKSGLNLSIVEGKDLSFQEIKNKTQSVSMFKEKKLIIIKNSLGGNKKFKEDFLANKDSFLKTEDIFVFFEEGSLPAKDALADFLKKKAAKSQEFSFLSGARLKEWIRKELEKYQASAEGLAVEKLGVDVGGDLWQMSNEISKLASFKKGEKITVEDVNLLVRPKVEADIFKTVDFIAKKDKKSALLLVKKHLEKGESPFYIFSMINFQFRNLLIVKAKSEEEKEAVQGNPNSWAKELGMHPFVFRKALSQSKYFKMEDLKKIYRNIFKIDLATKTGELSPEIALDIFIAQL
ncbi:MAG: DNA polymerase III subunit delta [Candidatus Paceibacterota bacterium]|jgi:DNA polymerase III delta subunit